MPRNLKNPDGTVNLEAINAERKFLQGKYAQNAENLKRNLEAASKATSGKEGEGKEGSHGQGSEVKGGPGLPPPVVSKSDEQEKAKDLA
ncbi:hypothetical protein IE53DRAFT_367866 [Violaceomyces palustris]|uniref:Uncharacterized protein n=1 Tax=Violaceomyces palustris TaxID=1673888 RepID=A0ACD0P0J8_9BASI|nr:hypothetical protein IE53DRAFT_367866 [Violaceomyces palustris]